MGERKGFSVPAVGGSSLLTVFGILCLTVFALLSLSTVLSDKRLSDSSIAAVENYYAADVRAEEILAQIRQGDVPEEVSVEGRTYSYTCPISETQDLSVVVRAEEDGSYTILSWEAVSTLVWESDSGLDVWDGVIFE